MGRKIEFTVINDPALLDMEENHRVMRRIWGEPAVKKGQRMKESRYIMTKRICTIPDAEADIVH